MISPAVSAALTMISCLLWSACSLHIRAFSFSLFKSSMGVAEADVGELFRLDITDGLTEDDSVLTIGSLENDDT